MRCHHLFRDSASIDVTSGGQSGVREICMFVAIQEKDVLETTSPCSPRTGYGFRHRRSTMSTLRRCQMVR